MDQVMRLLAHRIQLSVLYNLQCQVSATPAVTRMERFEKVKRLAELAIKEAAIVAEYTRMSEEQFAQLLRDTDGEPEQ